MVPGPSELHEARAFPSLFHMFESAACLFEKGAGGVPFGTMQWRLLLHAHPEVSIESAHEVQRSAGVREQ